MAQPFCENTQARVVFDKIVDRMVKEKQVELHQICFYPKVLGPGETPIGKLLVFRKL